MRGAYFKFRTLGEALCRRGRLFEGGGGVAVIRRFTVVGSSLQINACPHNLVSYSEGTLIVLCTAKLPMKST